jgi:hypothetical protein
MHIFGRQKNNEALILDIGSSTVLLGFVQYNKEGKGKLTYVNKFISPLTEFSQSHTAYKEVLAGAGALLAEFALQKKSSKHTPIFVFFANASSFF